ncbi:MAG: aminotransferase class V-fold PLP-dependent enzyme [Actinomycetota bacterium]|nr:aminotransferase class V-fold PLP-dependent enzyme [Actinomycetota bacterium]
MTLPSQRHLFDIPEEICYLNCAYMSPQLREVREAGMQALAIKSHPWQVTPADFFDEPERARELFAQIVGGDAEGVAIIPSVSYGMAVAAANLPVQRGQNIVVLSDQFPSNVYPWRQLARQRSARLVTVPGPADHDWTAAVLDHIDESTAIAAVPNCHWTDGSLVDLVRVGERAREVGAALVVDATQSLGAHPMDVSRVRPDFLVSAAYKWLLGPYSLGFMYVDEAHRRGTPIEQNWIVRAGSEDFARLVDYRDDYAPGARRYDVGERSNFNLLPMATTAMRRILDWGVENISETAGHLTDLIEKEAAKLGIEAVPAKFRARHMVGLHLGPTAPPDLAARLAAENVFVSVRGDSVRVSPHLYNTEEDVSRLFKVLSRLM